MSTNYFLFERKFFSPFRQITSFFLVLLASNVASCRRKNFDRQFSASVGNTTSYQVLQHSGWVTASYPAVTGSNRYEKLDPKKRRIWVVVVAELVEPSLPTREFRGSNPVIGKILSTKLWTDFVMEKTKIKKKRQTIAHLQKRRIFFSGMRSRQKKV